MPYMRDGKRDYKRQNANVDSKPAAKKHRAADMKIQRELDKAGLAHKGDGMDDGHKKAFSKGGGTELSNVHLQTPHANRSFARNPDSSMKTGSTKKVRRKLTAP